MNQRPDHLPGIAPVAASCLDVVADIVEVRDLALEARDGYPLAATLYENRVAPGPLLLVSSATAVSRRFYDRFARTACLWGFRAVMTYDYRGIAGSNRPAGWPTRLNMKDWAIQDFAAATRALRAIDPVRPMTAIGQSIGGIALSLSGLHPLFARQVLVASGHGWRGHTDERWKLTAWMDLAARPLSALLGHAPGWLGLGQQVPASILADWARFTRQRDYLFSDPAVPEARRMDLVDTPTLALGFTDDPWTTERALDALLAKFTRAPIARHVIRPADVEIGRIGHMGFFREEARTSLWPPVLAWLGTGERPGFGQEQAA